MIREKNAMLLALHEGVSRARRKRRDAERVSPTYARYLESSLRKTFQIRYAPMRVKLRSSHKKDK